MNTNILVRIAPFFLGLALGIAGTVYLPGYVRPHLPEWIVGKTIAVDGTVAAKQKKENSLLLTVDTPEGALLATFTRKVDEINLLVNVTDEVALSLTKYAPFVEDPRILRVTKKTQPSPASAETAAPAVKQKEVAPKTKEKTTPAAPAPASRATATHS